MDYSSLRDFLVSKNHVLPKTPPSPQCKRWLSNSEILGVLLAAQSNPHWLSRQVHQRPVNGSVILYDKILTNYKQDGFIWKNRKAGHCIREDHCRLKVSKFECINGVYAHSAFLSSFHRRTYWLDGPSNIIMVHYLNVLGPGDDNHKLTLPSNTDIVWNIPNILEQVMPLFHGTFENSDFRSIMRDLAQKLEQFGKYSVVFSKTSVKFEPNSSSDNHVLHISDGFGSQNCFSAEVVSPKASNVSTQQLRTEQPVYFKSYEAPSTFQPPASISTQASVYINEKEQEQINVSSTSISKPTINESLIVKDVCPQVVFSTFGGQRILICLESTEGFSSFIINLEFSNSRGPVVYQVAGTKSSTGLLRFYCPSVTSPGLYQLTVEGLIDGSTKSIKSSPVDFQFWEPSSTVTQHTSLHGTVPFGSERRPDNRLATALGLSDRRVIQAQLLETLELIFHEMTGVNPTNSSILSRLTIPPFDSLDCVELLALQLVTCLMSTLSTARSKDHQSSSSTQRRNTSRTRRKAPKTRCRAVRGFIDGDDGSSTSSSDNESDSSIPARSSLREGEKRANPSSLFLFGGTNSVGDGPQIRSEVSSSDYTLLHLACALGYSNLVQVLLHINSAGSSVTSDIPTLDSSTSSRPSRPPGHPHQVAPSMLLARHSDPSYSDSNHRLLPLHIAALLNKIQICDMLVTIYPAALRACSSMMGLTPAGMCASSGHNDLVARLSALEDIVPLNMAQSFRGQSNSRVSPPDYDNIREYTTSTPDCRTGSVFFSSLDNTERFNLSSTTDDTKDGESRSGANVGVLPGNVASTSAAVGSGNGGGNEGDPFASASDRNGDGLDQPKLFNLATRIIAAMPARIKDPTPSHDISHQYPSNTQHPSSSNATSSWHLDHRHPFYPPLGQLRQGSSSKSSFSAQINSPPQDSGLSTPLTLSMDYPGSDRSGKKIKPVVEPNPAVESGVDQLPPSSSSPPPTRAEFHEFFNRRLNVPGADNMKQPSPLPSTPPLMAPSPNLLDANDSLSSPPQSCGSRFLQASMDLLTLSDDEQRKLYQAAVVIQSAFRKHRTSSSRSNLPGSSSLTGGGNTDVPGSSSLNIGLLRCSPNEGGAGGIKRHLPSSSDDLTGLMKDPSTCTISSSPSSKFNVPKSSEPAQAAQIIQFYYRRYLKYRYFRRIEQAATLIQSQYRSYVAQKRFKETREAARVIQQQYRAYRNINPSHGMSAAPPGRISQETGGASVPGPSGVLRNTMEYGGGAAMKKDDPPVGVIRATEEYNGESSNLHTPRGIFHHPPDVNNNNVMTTPLHTSAVVNPAPIQPTAPQPHQPFNPTLFPAPATAHYHGGSFFSCSFDHVAPPQSPMLHSAQQMGIHPNCLSLAHDDHASPFHPSSGSPYRAYSFGHACPQLLNAPSLTPMYGFHQSPLGPPPIPIATGHGHPTPSETSHRHHTTATDVAQDSEEDSLNNIRSPMELEGGQGLLGSHHE